MGENKRGAGLTRQTVIDTALRLLDEVGLDGLTVRRLASELGVQSPALYWHLRDKQELLDGMADAIVLSAGMGPPRDGEPWQDWLTRRARAYRDSLLAHRDGARLVANAASLGPATIRMFDEELTAMIGHGFTPVLALRTITSLTRYVNGCVLQEQSERREHPGTPPDRLAALAGQLDGGMEATLITAFRESGGSFGEDAFEHGLRALIDGTAIALARTA
ncbi:TetR/AcrR family transcriptional regulator C-terminal domain-containing protein [Streptosporangium sp. NBC_01495]|uniref:TetR/AcrR family transcriptional regulator C-terminal domain-containing protein n=1 Tax=Streptosporangium sp. NBC_01495 TaxID=2903899 RepID=UPI002E33B36A|nr:TetR/AcrR family transcriptional regulator C-terminal domain-containing protein [Streptosporangium sp. NBC_01495]